MSVDPLLQFIVNAAEGLLDKTEGQTKTDITVMCGGMLVSGTICTPGDYMMSAPFTDMLRDLVGKFDDFLKIGRQESPHLIHLTGVQFFRPGGSPLPPTEALGVSWRGRLSEISGFNMGRMVVDPLAMPLR